MARQAARCAAKALVQSAMQCSQAASCAYAAAHLEYALPASPELVVGGLLRQQLPQRHGLVVRRGDEVGGLWQSLQVAHHLAADVLGAVPACRQELGA